MCQNGDTELLDLNRNLCQSELIAETAPSEAVVRLSKPNATKVGRPRTVIGSPWDDQGISKATYYRRIKPTLPTQISYATDALRWFCIRTEYGAEKRVFGELTKEGFEAFFPQRWVPPVAARRTETGRALPAMPGYLVALLPRYLMVRFDRSAMEWRYITTMDGVERIFGTSPVWPTPIPESDMAALRKGLTEDGILYDDAPSQHEVTKRRWVDMATALLALQTEAA